MGGSQSTTSSRAAKFSGNPNRRSVRAVKSAPATDPTMRRTTSVRSNTNRNVKEFSKFWSDGGSVARSSNTSTNRASTKRQNGGSVRRARTQSIDARRASSNCLPVPSATGRSLKPSIKRKERSSSQRPTSFRTTSTTTACNSSTPTTSTCGSSSTRRRTPSRTTLTTVSSTNGINVPYPSESTPQSARSDIYLAEFNQAAIAAARLKRLSLTSQKSPFITNRPTSRTYHQNPHSPETAIY